MWVVIAVAGAAEIAAAEAEGHRRGFAAPPEPEWMEIERQRSARNARATQETIRDARTGIWLLLALLLSILALAGWGVAQLAPHLPNNTPPVHVPDDKDPVRHAKDRGDVRGADRSE